MRCVYVSPLRSLNYDIERNLNVPLDAIRRRLDRDDSPVKVGVRTGDTSAHRASQSTRSSAPHIDHHA